MRTVLGLGPAANAVEFGRSHFDGADDTADLFKDRYDICARAFAQLPVGPQFSGDVLDVFVPKLTVAGATQNVWNVKFGEINIVLQDVADFM